MKTYKLKNSQVYDRSKIFIKCERCDCEEGYFIEFYEGRYNKHEHIQTYYCECERCTYPWKIEIDMDNSNIVNINQILEELG